MPPLMCKKVNGKYKIDLVRAAVGLFIIATLFLSVVFVYDVSFKDNPPITVMPAHALSGVDRDIYTGGDTMIATTTFCKEVRAKTTIYRTFVDGLNHQTNPTESVGLEAGCYEDLPDLIEIPITLPSSSYQLRYNVIVDVPIFFDMFTFPREVEFFTEEFTVIHP